MPKEDPRRIILTDQERRECRKTNHPRPYLLSEQKASHEYDVTRRAQRGRQCAQCGGPLPEQSANARNRPLDSKQFTFKFCSKECRREWDNPDTEPEPTFNERLERGLVMVDNDFEPDDV